jgi:hypothetical protein
MGRNAVPDESRAPLKEADLYSWARRQAELLRAGRLGEIDPEAVNGACRMVVLRSRAGDVS